MDADEILLRAASLDDLPALKDVYRRAKASHGYPEAEMARFVAETDETLTAQMIAANPFVVATRRGQIVGFAGLEDQAEPDAIHLEFLFVDPEVHGVGIGQLLFEWAMTEAERLGFAAIEFHSDPNVVGFYERMGAERIGETPSTAIPGRMIPKFRKRVSSTPA